MPRTKPSNNENALAAISYAPEFLRPALVESSSFRERIGLSVSRSIRIGIDELSFDSRAFYAALQRLYSEKTARPRVRSQTGQFWTITRSKENGSVHLDLARSGVNHRLPDYFALRKHPDDRVAGLADAIQQSMARKSSFDGWFELLRKRQLSAEEDVDLDKALDNTPLALWRLIAAEITKGEGKITSLVPSSREYFDQLCEAAVATSLEEYASSNFSRLATEYLTDFETSGLLQVLLLCSHSEFTAQIVKLAPSVDQLRSMLQKVSDLDVLSRVAAIELALAMLPSTNPLEDEISSLIESLLEEDETDKESSFFALFAFVMLVEGELSRTKVIDHWPPFARRMAAFAQASLIHRTLLGRAQVRPVAEWGINERGHQAFVRNLIDLRTEPRWMPDQINPQQLKQEFLGRILNAASGRRDHIQSDRLNETLFGASDHSVVNQANPVFAFAPGPLEGGVDNQDAPKSKVLQDALAAQNLSEPLSPSSLAAFINLRGRPEMGPDDVDRLVDALRQAGHRLDCGKGSEEMHYVMSGLAGVASTYRSGGLSGELRVLARKMRPETENERDYLAEVRWALTCAAAHANLEEWGKFVGDWFLELAFAVSDYEKANQLLSECELLFFIEPRLAIWLGRSHAALASYVSSFGPQPDKALQRGTN